jgi:glutathione S-transferase
MPLMLLSLIISRIETAPMPFFAKPIAKGIAAKVRGGYLDSNVKRNVDFLESSLQSSPWFCGDELTAADIQMSFAVEAAAVRALRVDGQEHEKVDRDHVAGAAEQTANMKSRVPVGQTANAVDNGSHGIKNTAGK